MCGVLVPLLSFRTQSELMGCYLPASHRVLESLALPGPEAWVYPPIFTTPVLLITLVPVAIARMLWCTMLVTAAVLATRAIWNTLMLDPLFRDAVKLPWKFFTFGSLLAASSLGHTIVPLTYQAHDVIVFMLIAFGGWYSARALQADGIRSRCERGAGVFFGLAASCKVMPVLFLPALFAQRRWRACIAMGITGIVAAAAFDLVAFLLTGRAHFYAWLQLAAGGSDLTASGGGRWDPWNPLNQSGTGILNRMMIPTPVDRGLHHECMIVQVGDSGRRIVLGAWIVLMVGALLITLWKTKILNYSAAQREAIATPMHALAMAGATACTYVLIAPHSSNYHFAPIALSAAAMIGYMLTRGFDRCMALCLFVMIAIELTPGRDVLGGALTDIKLAYGSVGICAFAGMLGALRLLVCSLRTTAPQVA